METMTSRQRVTAAFEHRHPDRTPVFEYVLLSPNADAIVGHPYGGDPHHWAHLLDELGWDGAVRRNAVDRLELALALEHDMMYVSPNPQPPVQSPSPPPPPEAAPPDDPVAVVRQRCEHGERNFRAPPDEAYRVYDVLHEEMARRGVDLPILAPAWAHGVWTDTDLMMTMALEPEVAHRHFRLATRGARARVEGYLKRGIDIIGVGGDFAGNRPLISPEAYRTFIMPEVRTVTRHIHAGGAWAVNASDGDLWSVIDDYLIGTDVDGYCEIDMHAGMDLAKLKARFGGRITLVGNLDCGNVLSFGTTDDVRRHVTECLDAGGGTGHILCVSNAVTHSVPLRNYLTVVDTYREYYGLAPILTGLPR